MKRRVALVFSIGIGLAGLGGFTALTLQAMRQHVTRPSSRAVYYCPMHPTYTSDRPGDCPICNMKLVKKDSSQQPASTPRPALRERRGGQHTAHSTQPVNTPRDLCYLHNCPKVHEGKPCPMLVVAKEGEQVTCPVCGTHVVEAAAASTTKKLLYWTDPMIPGFTSDKPGKSPMGMELVPVYAEEAGSDTAGVPAPPGYAPVLLTPRKQQLIGVTVATVEQRPITKTIRTVGVIAHDPELYQAQQEYIQADRAWQQAVVQGSAPAVPEQAKRLADASRFRLQHLGLSDALIEEIRAWTEPDHRLLLGGAGEYWVYAPIYEYELSLVPPGVAASIETQAFPGRVFSGTVKAIDRMLDAATRTVRVRILMRDAEGILKPDMYVNVSIILPIGAVLAVPESAVFLTGERQLVFVDQGQGLFEPREVTLGVKADGVYEVKAGLREGERVVTSGNFLIDSESRLKGALQGLDPEGHHHGQ